MILTNLNIVPGRRIEGTLGIAYGYASVVAARGGKTFIGPGPQGLPWKETPEDFDRLFREAENRLARSCEKLGGDAVVKVEGRLSRDGKGNPDMLLIGTAVKLDVEVAEVEVPVEKAAAEEGAGSVSINIEGEKVSWKPPQATTPTMDVLKRIRERGEKDAEQPQDDTKRILLMVKEVGISQERAKLLIESGFDTIEKISKASVPDISAIDGINPTQARIVRKKAQEILSLG